MKNTVGKLTRIVAVVAALLATSFNTIGLTEPFKPEQYRLAKLFPGQDANAVYFEDSIAAGALLDLSQGKPVVIAPVSNGDIVALDGETGELSWKIAVPAPPQQQSQLISTPVMIGTKLVIVYQCLDKGVRTSHRLAVIDLARKQLDENFPVLTLSAEKPSADGMTGVKFNPPTAFSHAALQHAKRPGSKLGYVYAAFGNAGDTQPYHGWLFEIDMDAWRTQGAHQAVKSVLLTTPEAECPTTMEYGNQEMICGGGIWAPAGPQIYPAGASFELFVPAGNGQIDLARRDYANTVMRMQPGLNFDPGCDEKLCQNFNPSQPDSACMASCKNLFIPRLAADNPPLKPANRECDNKTFWECLAWMDYDLGANAPVKVTLKNGLSVLVQPGKDGAVYLIDADHLGTQYSRLPIVDICGTPSDICKAGWMGMIVTKPALAYLNDEPIVVIPTFSPDKSHPAGLVALKIVIETGKPAFKRFWQFPDPSTPKALQTFRSHPSLPAVSTIGKNNDPVVWTVDIGNPGTLYGVRIKDGALVAEQALIGTGRQLASPLIYDNTIYLASIMPGIHKAMIEAYRIEQ